MRLVFVQPDIPQNLGAAIRLAACFETPLHVVEPCAFPLTDKAVRRAAMDYGAQALVRRESGVAAFLEGPVRAEGRLVLFTTRGAAALWDFSFAPTDLLAFGSESNGAPQAVHAAADATVRIPIAPAARSLNVATAAAIALGEACRQMRGRDDLRPTVATEDKQ